MSALRIEYRGGAICLPEIGLWMDSRAARKEGERVFVSHAHADHLGRHKEVILTDPTYRLMNARIGGSRLASVLAYGEPASFEHCGNVYRITLYPAGHILGSAMALIEADGETLLYTGDFKLSAGFACEPCEPVQADRLIMETTFGKPHYRFPSRWETMESIIAFCSQTLKQGGTPMLLAYSLGKSQELLAGLAQANFPIVVHRTIDVMNAVYREFGRAFPQYDVLDNGAVAGKVLICPPNAKLPGNPRASGRLNKAVITGWAIDRNCQYRSKADAAFPLSDHSDYDELVEFVRRVKPSRVYTTHGFACEFAWTLRDLGFNAQALGMQEQMTLALPGAYSD